MLAYWIVIASGVYGVVLQHYIPPLMTARVPAETVHSQIRHVRAGLCADAYEIVASVVGPIEEAVEEREWLEKEKATGWKTITRRPVAATPAAGAETIRTAYLEEIRPYLRADRRQPAQAPDLRRIGIETTEDIRPRVDRLRDICEQVRELDVQVRLHGWLHNWLFVHAPLSVLIFVLVVFHIYYALGFAVDVGGLKELLP
jgi:hypothetical protein